MLVFAAVMPHSPLLIPAIAKNQFSKVKKTLSSIDILKESFKQAKPDTVIVISAHGDHFPSAFSLPSAQTFESNFEEFGNFELRHNLPADLEFIDSFRMHQEAAAIPVMLKTETSLDHGVTVPIKLLETAYKNFHVVVIHPSLLDYQTHVDFGRTLHEEILSSNKRIAVIASAELSHALSPKGPETFSPQAKEFDKKIIQALKLQKSDSLVGLDKQLVDDAKECGLHALLIFQGILDDMNYDFQVLHYDAPFGVGMLVGECVFN